MLKNNIEGHDGYRVIMKRASEIIVVVVFLLFAIVQLNDGDAIKWVPPYLLIAYIAFNAYRDRYFLIGTAIVLIFYLIWMSTYITHMQSWISDGMPSITESMKAESPYIELSREFFGLLLCALAALYYLIKAKRLR